MKIGVIGDTHIPATHPGYFRFCRDVFDAWGCTKIVHIGDVVDFNAISFHEKYPDLPGARDEFVMARERLQPWVEAFPRALVCIGNHDDRVARMAESVSIPAEFIRPFPDIWGTPQWEWAREHVLDGVRYMHGKRRGGLNPALTSVKAGAGMSTVMGHVHTAGGVHWIAGPATRWFGLDTGCGADQRHPAMRYAEDNDRKWILSCAVVIDGHPYHEVMPCAPGERYHRSRFTRKSRSK